MYVHYTLESPFWSQEAFPGSFQNYFNMSISYRNDANIKSEFYGSVINIKQLEENLTHAVESFGAKNRHLAQKKSPVGILFF